MADCLLIVMLAPAVTVVGYEVLGHRHAEGPSPPARPSVADRSLGVAAQGFARAVRVSAADRGGRFRRVRVASRRGARDAEDDEDGQAKKSELPSTLQKSPAKAQRTFAKVHDAAAEQYGEGERAHRAAFDALKHSFEKVGDHWEPKDEKGPSDDARPERRPQPHGDIAPRASTPTRTKKHLMDVARRLDISGRSTMTKDELVDAIKKANRRVTAKKR